MNGKAAKALRTLAGEQNPALLLAIRQHYGDKTKDMSDIQIYRAAKKLYSNGKLRKFFKEQEQK